jgi:hypothetical protein
MIILKYRRLLSTGSLLCNPDALVSSHRYLDLLYAEGSRISVEKKTENTYTVWVGIVPFWGTGPASLVNSYRYFDLLSAES